MGDGPGLRRRRHVAAFAELTVPSANPSSLGGGKYQPTSFLGDAVRADVNYTKLELTISGASGAR